MESDGIGGAPRATDGALLGGDSGDGILASSESGLVGRSAPASSGLDLNEQVSLVPTDPGCYLWKGAAGEVLYVGKAKNLRARMKQYVLGQDERVKIPLLMSQVRSFEYIVVNSEHEALVLEMNLIRQYDPPFNVDFRDDKSYPYIAVTEGDVFPAIKFTREKHRPKTRYFGPYTNARAARETIDLCRKVVPVCTATCPEWRRVQRLLAAHPDDAAVAPLLLANRGRPCFDASVGLGPGVCTGDISPEDYRANVAAVERFLAGHRGEFERAVSDEMVEAAAELDFEKAARCRDRLRTLQRVGERQQVVFPSSINIDVVGFFREETIAGVHLFAVREGRTQRSCEFVLDKGSDVPVEELAGGFLKRYYGSGADLPDEVDLPVELPDAEVLAEWLTGLHGRKVALHVPRRGEKRRLLDLAEKNARHTLMRFMVRTSYADQRTNDALLQLESALALPNPPYRIECFDISTIHGKFTVASMVVFTNGKPDKSQYRRFKVHGDFGEANDFLSMQEVLGRPGAHGGRALRLAPRPAHRRRRQAPAHRGAHPAWRAGPRHPGRWFGEKRRRAVRALERRGPRRASERVSLAVPGEAGARRVAPLRHRVPPRAARQGHDGERPRRGPRRGREAQEGGHEGVRVDETPARGDRRADRGSPRRARGRGAAHLGHAARVGGRAGACRRGGGNGRRRRRIGVGASLRRPRRGRGGPVGGAARPSGSPRDFPEPPLSPPVPSPGPGATNRRGTR